MHVQSIPRPHNAIPGGPPPWDGVCASQLVSLTLARVVERLGTHGDQQASDDGKRNGPQAAVLVALFEQEGDTRVVLTRRAATLRSHTGEVSFPGGRLDEGETLFDCALREAAEEVGLTGVRQPPLCWLTPTTTRVSDAEIFPVVVALESVPVLRPNPSEVARAFDVSLSALVQEGVFHGELWPTPETEESHPVYFFEAATEMIWGATARMLVELLSLIYVTS